MSRSRAGAEQEQGSSWSHAKAEKGRSESGVGGSTPGLCQEHGRSGQEQCNSKAGALFVYFLPVSAPIRYFVGRSRAGPMQEQSKSRAGAGQEQGRS